MNERQQQYIKLLTNTMYDVQALRKALDNRIFAFSNHPDLSHHVMAKELKDDLSALAHEMEQVIEKRIAKAVQVAPVMRWLTLVKGIGPRYSGSLIGMLETIRRFPTVSALWSYCGMDVITICASCNKIHLTGRERHVFLDRQVKRRWAVHLLKDKLFTREEAITLSRENPDLSDKQREVLENYGTWTFDEYQKNDAKLCRCEEPDVKHVAPKRQYFSGLLLTHNPFLKMTCWKIAGQFVKQGKFYRTHYDQQKEFYTQRDGDTLTKGHIENRARRAMVKIFLSHLWEMWRRAEGLPSGETYLQYKLGGEFARHHTLIKPPYDSIFDIVKQDKKLEFSCEPADR